jgi:hypothetical protein
MPQPAKGFPIAHLPGPGFRRDNGGSAGGDVARAVQIRAVEMSDDKKPQRPADRNPRANQTDDERRSRQADVGDAPEQGGDGIQPQDTGKDMPATYEPDKRPGHRQNS